MGINQPAATRRDDGSPWLTRRRRGCSICRLVPEDAAVTPTAHVKITVSSEGQAHFWVIQPTAPRRNKEGSWLARSRERCSCPAIIAHDTGGVVAVNV